MSSNPYPDGSAVDRQPSYQPPVHRMPQHDVIMQQPGDQWPGQRFTAGVEPWVGSMGPPLNCPPGLEYLTTIDQLIVKQKIELFEVFTGWEGNNQYKVKNSLGQNVFMAEEENDCCNRQCAGSSRSFDIKLLDYHQRVVLHVYRPLRCSSCCFPCCLQELEISSPPGTPIGYVIQKWSLCAPCFEIQDEQRRSVLLIEGPICLCRCWSDIEFKVLSLDGKTQVGRISKQWMGLVQETFTDADTFGVTFPMDLDVKMKAVMLGATFLIDFMYFENNEKQHRLKRD